MEAFPEEQIKVITYVFASAIAACTLPPTLSTADVRMTLHSG